MPTGAADGAPGNGEDTPGGGNGEPMPGGGKGIPGGGAMLNKESMEDQQADREPILCSRPETDPGGGGKGMPPGGGGNGMPAGGGMNPGGGGPSMPGGGGMKPGGGGAPPYMPGPGVICGGIAVIGSGLPVMSARCTASCARSSARVNGVLGHLARLGLLPWLFAPCSSACFFFHSAKSAGGMPSMP